MIWLRQFHHFAQRQAFYPVTLSTLLAGVLLVGRIYRSNEWTYVFLMWNLFLAWIPYLTSLWTHAMYEGQPQRWWYLLIPSMVWLIFFPNAPYIVTDFLHLQARPLIPVWYDIGLIATFAWTGLFLGVFSLRCMQVLVKAIAGPVVSWLFVVGIISLSGLGIYVGRFLGWNSWDLLLQPQTVLTDMVIHLTHPLKYPATFGVSFIFALFLFVCYLTVTVDPLRQHS